MERRNPAIAWTLGWLLPGAGHWYLGQRARALVMVCVIALLATVVTALVPRIPVAASVRLEGIDTLWVDGLYKQISGFVLIGLVAIGLLLSLRKRVKRFRWGSFPGWRVLHASAKNSVWPGNGKASRGITSLQIGPVHTASAMSSASSSIAQARYVAARSPVSGVGLPSLMPTSSLWPQSRKIGRQGLSSSGAESRGVPLRAKKP